jgi:exodeoxyribonuclease VII small subunit
MTESLRSTAALEAMTFEELLAALEEITQQMESREVGIEVAMDLYEQAEQLHTAAADRLERITARLDQLDPPRSPLN